MTDEEEQREYVAFKEWVREQAILPRTKAAAFGASAEHEAMSAFIHLLVPFLKRFSPGRSIGDLFLELQRHCEDSSLPVDLREVNRLRAEKELPPLASLPRVDAYTRFTPPMPEDRDTVAEQERAFYEWASTKMYGVYEDAALYNITPQEALLAMLPWNMEQLALLFPKLRVASMIRRLTAWLPRFKPESLDEEQLQKRRNVLGVFQQVGQEIQRGVEKIQAEDDPKAKA